MKFLVPSGGDIGGAYGVLTAPGHVGVPTAITNGLPWAADNQAFTQGFNPDVFFPWLESMSPFRSQCLFVTAPDVVGDAIATARLWRQYAPLLSPWPLAFVAQDGQEGRPLPSCDEWAALFVGGSTAWKESGAALSVIRRAQLLGKHIHIGRVNWWGRYWRFRVLRGSEDFTCDGTRQRFDGRDNTLKAWSSYENQPPLIQI